MNKKRPLAHSLSRFKTFLGIAAALGFAGQQGANAASISWEGTTGATPGDGFQWLDPLNWMGDAVPTAADDIIFEVGTPGVIALGGDQTLNSLFVYEDFTLGAYGTNDVLRNASATGNVFVALGAFATINASYGGANGISLIGGGSLLLNHPLPVFGGNISVDGAGTTLVYRGEGPYPQYNGIGGAQEFGRFDQVTLGFQPAVRNITLTNGGEYKIIGAGNNAEANYKNIIIGSGGGTLNLAAGYLVQNLDDVGQITATSEAFTKAGKGRLIITGAMADANPLAGVVNVNGGMLSLDRLAGGSTTAGTRFTGIAATGATLNINAGGILMINNGSQGRLDVQTVNANDGSIIAFNSSDHIIGLEGGGTTLNISGTATLLARDLFGVQTQRFPRIRTVLTGTGTLNLFGNTNAGGTPRVVIERGSESTFSGTYRLNENMSFEAHPRNNPVANVGKVIANGDIEFAGWGGTLDVRDSDPDAANVKDYTVNDITFTTTQVGAQNTISNVRATAATGAGHLFNYGTLTMGNHRLLISGNNGYQTGFANTASIRGNAVVQMNADNSFALFLNSAAIEEDAAGRSLTLIKAGNGTTTTRDVITDGTISISNLEIATGTLQLRGAAGSIVAGFGGAAPTITVNGTGLIGNAANLPSQGLLHLDNNTGHTVGTTGVIVAANNNDRIVDSAILNMRGNSVVRLTSAAGLQSTETIGTANVFGHGVFDVIKTGAAPAPVALTLSTLNMGPNGTANFTGTLGGAGVDSARVVIPGTAAGFMGARFHQGNEWAKYDATLDNGFALGVQPFAAGDYTINPTEDLWSPAQHTKLNSATGVTLTGNRNVSTLNLQFSAANQSINTDGNILTVEQGGILTSAQVSGIRGNAGVGGLTAGTASPSSLFVHSNATLEIHVPIVDNVSSSPVTFVKSGTGNVVLSHHSRTVGQAQVANPFAAATWSSTNTGGWVINDGMLNVHRGQFLGATPTTVTLNGGQLEINEPVSTANDSSILPGWGHHIVVNGNAMVGFDDNGEATDATTGDRTLVKLGSLTINNGSILGMAAYSDNDIAYMGGTTINGRATFNIGATGRSTTNSSFILSGVVTGGGFDVTNLSGNGSVLILGGTAGDATNNTFNGGVTVYGSTMRFNKANGFIALPDTAASEDLVINGGVVAWGPGQHGDLATTNSVVSLNNNVANGITPLSSATVKAAGMNQIADTATVTLLTGTLGEADRINNDKWGTLNQRNGTFNVGLGAIEVDTANIFGGAFGIDRSGSFKAGTLNLQPGSPDLNITTGIAAPGLETVLEVGAGGLNMTGQNIILGSGSSGNVSGSGAVLKLGGDVTANGSDLLGGSYARKGIFIQTGSSFRELGTSRLDLLGGNRTFTIGGDTQFTITAPLANGGLIKAGGGGLILEPFQPGSFAGPVTVNGGTLWARADGAFGTAAGGVTINNGGTVKLESSWVYGDSFTVSGPGATVPGDANVREPGALIGETGTNRLTGGVTLAGNATITSNTVIDVSVAPGAGGAAYRIGNLRLENATGVTGNGTLTLSGHGDGVVLGGINTTTGGLVKDGAGRWTIAGASTLTGTVTVTAGNLLITNAAALGGVGAGTRVIGGALEIAGGISLAEPLALHGNGSSTLSGALINVSGANTITGPVTVDGNVTLRSGSGTLTFANSVTGTEGTVTLSGSGNGVVAGALSTGTVGLPGLVKSGSGTWTLAGANTVSGTTTVSAGSLVLDYRTQNNSKLNAGEPLILRGGSVSLVRNASANTTQAVASLDLIAGAATIALGGGANSLAFSVGVINRSPGATVDFDLGTNGLVVATAPLTNGIVGGYATVSGTDWASLSGNEIVPLSTYTPLNTGGGVDGDNSLVSGSQRLANSLVTNSLKLTGGLGIALDAQNLTLTTGGLLYTGTGTAGISGSGTLAAATEADELIIHTKSGLLDIATPIIGFGNGSLTKSGAGTLVLSGASSFTGSVNINGGTLLIPAAPAFPGTLGASVGGGNRIINLNGGTFGIMGDWDINDWDAGTAGVQSLQFNVGPAGGAIKTLFGGNITINDGSATSGVPTQLMGSGDLTLSGGGRYTLSGGTPQFLGFGGNVTVQDGVLTVGHSNSLGGRQEQTLTLNPGSVIINNTGFGLGQNGLPNNVVANGGVTFHAVGGNRVFGGSVQLGGTNTIALMERDNLGQDRQIYFNGRVAGENVTLNVFGVNNVSPLYLAGGSNDLTGTINLNTNAVLEVRMPGSLGMNAGDVTVNLNGINSRLLLRHYQNGDYHTNVFVNADAEINSDRLAGFAGGANQILTINNLTSNTNGILSFNGGNTYATRVEGVTTLNANSVLNVNNTNVILDNGITFANGATNLDKRGNASIILRGPSNHSGLTNIQQGFVILQEGGTLANTDEIRLRGGELRLDNSEVVNGNRLNDAAPISLGGGVLRITGQETIGTVTAEFGTTQIAYNPTSETVVSALTLPNFTRAVGAVVQFQSDLVTTGATTLASSRVSPRVLILDMPNSTQTIPGLLGNNNLDFIQYDGTTSDGGQPLGVRDMRNPGTANAPANYSNDTAETGWNDGIILRRTNAGDNTVVTYTLTADRALDAIKIETGGTNRDVTFDLGASRLRIEGGGVLDVAATTHDTNINGTTGALTAGPAIPGAGTAELFLGGSSTLFNINAIVDNNGTQAVAVVKTGAGTVSLNGNNTYTGGTYVTSGVLNTTVNTGFGAASNPITLSGGTLQFNIPSASNDVALGGLGQSITARSNSLIIIDNGTGGLNNDIALGGLTIDGATLGIRAFDSMDVKFSGTHTFAGTPTIDLPQAGSGSNPNTVDTASVATIDGPISGSGFYVSSSGNANDTATRLQIGGGATDTQPNTYVGKVTVLNGSNNDDLFVELNKAAGTTAITGDLQIDGGSVILNASNQIADASRLLINRGAINFNGQSETIASVDMKGGGFITNPITGTPLANTIDITGNVDVTGISNFAGVTTGFTVGNNSTVNVNGTMRIGTYGRVHLSEGQAGGFLNLNGALEMTGALLHQNNGAGPNTVRLSGDVTTFAASVPSNIGNSNDSDTFLDLNGTRTFTVADGSAAIDLSISTVVRNGLSTGGLVKDGEGTVQIQGGGTANNYSGGTFILAGSVVLFKSTNVDAIPTGTVALGDGVGGARADRLIVRNSEQIANAADLMIATSGLLDLETYNTSETIGSLSGSGNVDLGPNSVFTVNSAVTTTYAGNINGAGGFVKDGDGVLELTGTNQVLAGTTINGTGGLTVTGVLGGNVTLTSGTLAGDGSIQGTVIVAGGVLSPGNGPGSLDTGTLNLSAGTLAAEIAGLSSYDTVNVSGTVVLGGTLSLSGSFVPDLDDAFYLIINDGTDFIQDTFLGIPQMSFVTVNGVQMQATYTADFEGNNPYSQTGNDFALVPEPGSATLLLGGLGSLLALRRRRREA